jgi:two-component system OmpR family response regulator
LVVDDSEETHEVLQTALGRRGMHIFSASRGGDALELARQHHPDLIVLDLEVDRSPSRELAGSLAAQSRADQAPLVMLGSVRRDGPRLPDGEFVAKPYHYGPLIRRIEELLETARPESSVEGRTIREPLSCRRCSSSAGPTRAHGSS